MKIIHLIPEDGLGGVEQAARSLEPFNNLDIEVAFLRGKTLSEKKFINVISDSRVKLNSLSFYINGFRHLVKKNPEVVITSLWRASIIGIVYKLYKKLILKENMKFVVFLHADRFAHRVDKIVTTIGAFLADEIWTDSTATATSLFKNRNLTRKMQIISFLIKNKNLDPVDMSKKDNNFVFWGRLARQKRVDIAIRLFHEVKKKYPSSLFYIFGPDGGELDSLKKLVLDLDLASNVLFMGVKQPNHYPSEAKNAKFFINTSSHEGMAIAVTEAMQLGLVPIVTPVGEIANYCINYENSIYYSEDVEYILKVFENTSLYSKLRRNAIDYWNSKNDYSTDFNNNCLRILSTQY